MLWGCGAILNVFESTGILASDVMEKNQLEKEKNKKFDEVSLEIESALKDTNGVLSHQKRIGFCLSEGIKEIIEEYLKKENVLKSGFKIDHRIFKKKKENVKEILSNKITSPIESLSKIDKLLDVAYKIESKRNDLVYGKPTSESTLFELIKLFLEIKNKESENE